jgi:hypothetical protein
MYKTLHSILNNKTQKARKERERGKKKRNGLSVNEDY